MDADHDCAWKRETLQLREEVDALKGELSEASYIREHRKNRPGDGAHYRIQYPNAVMAKAMACLWVDGAVTEKTAVPRRRVESLFRQHFGGINTASLIGRLSEATGMKWTAQTSQRVKLQRDRDGAWQYRHESQIDEGEAVKETSKPGHYITFEGRGVLKEYAKKHPEVLKTPQIEAWAKIAPKEQVQRILGLMEKGGEDNDEHNGQPARENRRT